MANQVWLADYGSLICDADNQIIARVVDNHATGEITANQYLIAAAPELLSACESVLEMINRRFGEYNLVINDSRFLLQSAIAKARGEA